MSGQITGTIPAVNSRPNPYVGPRAFKLNEKLYGREKEATAIFDLLLAERVVLLHAQSGAGKSSIIQAALVPLLEADGFNVLPVMRVSRPPTFPEHEMVNRYARSVLLDLEATANNDGGDDPTSVSLTDYFEQRSDRAKEKPEVLIFDQFEEMFTLDVADSAAKEEFFKQLGIVLQNRNRWAIIAMRDDFIGAIAPYQQWLPTRLAHRYRLELLTPKAANDSIRGPAKAVGVEYDDGAVHRLVEDLRTVRQQKGPKEFEQIAGPYIEPVHLQVVCTDLWRRLSPKATTVCEADVETVGDVDAALGAYYSMAVLEAARDGNCDEGLLRTFIGTQLIRNDVRAQTLMGSEMDAGVASDALEALGDRYVVRRDDRRGAIWYELAHDRLIGPVLRNNAKWKEKHDPPMLRIAEEWERLGRPDRLLMFAHRNHSLRGILNIRARLRELRAQNEAAALASTDKAPKLLKEYLRNSRRLRSQQRVFWFVVGVGLLLVMSSVYTFSKMQENSALKQKSDSLSQLIDSINTKTAALIVARDSTEKVANILYQKTWGLVDINKSAVLASIAANEKLKQVAVSSPRASRQETTIKYFFKRSDPQRVEFAMRELGYTVETAPARAEDIGTNALSYGPDVPLEDVRVIALALARTGAELKRICPLRDGSSRRHSVEIIGSANAQPLKSLTLDELSSFGLTKSSAPGQQANDDAVNRLHCSL